MKLNPDCIRAILLWLEENQQIDAFSGMGNKIASFQLPEMMNSTFRPEDILYSIKLMVDEELLEGTPLPVDGACHYIINDITLSGHKFLENVRSPDKWQKLKLANSNVETVVHDVQIESHNFIRNMNIYNINVNQANIALNDASVNAHQIIKEREES